MDTPATTFLGVVTTPTALKLGLVTGTRDQPGSLPLKEASIKLPDLETTAIGPALKFAWDALHAVIQAHKVDTVVLVKAVGSQFNGPSETRLKLEAAIELMCANANLKQVSLHPNTVANEAKRFDIYTGDSAEKILANGKFKSKEIQAAHLAAWCGLIPPKATAGSAAGRP